MSKHGADKDAPADWPQMDELPAASAQMIQWHAPETAAALIALGWDEGHELLCDGFRCGHRNPYQARVTSSAETAEGSSDV